jgi:Homeodomain-like domain-containing protein
MTKTPISEELQRQVVKMWLDGKTWKEIMQATDLSSSSISNILSRWKKKLDDLDPEAVRQFISTTKKEGMPTLSQCAEGFRMANMLAELGMADNQDGQFLKDLRECLGADIPPQHLARLLKEVVDFSRNEGFPLSQLGQHLKSRQEAMQRLESCISESTERKKKADQGARQALEKARTTLQEIESFKPLKEGLARHGVNLDEAMAAIDKLDDMERKGLSATQILSVNTDVESLKAKKQRLERDCGVAEKKLKKYEFSEELCDLADYYNIGPGEIRVFGKTIEKISRARGIEYWQAALILLDEVQRYNENEGLVPEYRRNDIAIQVQRAELENMRLLRKADELAQTTFIAAASRGIDQKEVRRFVHIVADHDLDIKKINNKLERAGRQKMLRKKLRVTRIATAAAIARQKPASAETVPGAENQEQEAQRRPSATSPQPAPPTLASQPKSQEGVVAQNTHSSSDARSSAADAEAANHGNEGYDEQESQEGGQTEAEGDKDASLEPRPA